MKARTASILACLALATTAMAQSTAFTYQGRLKNGAAPAGGIHDFRFTLFNVASGGVQVAPPQCVDNVAVTEGFFTTTLDFGQVFVTTAPLFLQIEVRADTGLNCANPSGLVLLGPRQPLTAAPIATHARSAFSLAAADGSPVDAVVADTSGNVGIGTNAPLAKLDVRGPVQVVNSGDQADLLWLANERSWVFRQEGSGANAALKLQSIGGGGNKNFIVQTDGFVGVGTALPLAKLDVRGNVKLGSSGQFFATSGHENLRLLRANVDGDGTILQGTGLSVHRVGEGLYDITFNPPFSGIPTVTTDTIQVWGSSLRWSSVVILTPSTVRIVTQSGSTTRTDSDFSLCVIGPR